MITVLLHYSSVAIGGSLSDTNRRQTDRYIDPFTMLRHPDGCRGSYRPDVYDPPPEVSFFGPAIGGDDAIDGLSDRIPIVMSEHPRHTRVSKR